LADTCALSCTPGPAALACVLDDAATMQTAVSGLNPITGSHVIERRKPTLRRVVKRSSSVGERGLLDHFLTVRWWIGPAFGVWARCAFTQASVAVDDSR
jgi:hypothetical protein